MMPPFGAALIDATQVSCDSCAHLGRNSATRETSRRSRLAPVADVIA